MLSADMIKAFKAILSENQREFVALSAKLDALSPLSVLQGDIVLFRIRIKL